MGLFLGCSLARKQVLVTWACGMVPSGLPLKCPDMSLDMRLLAVSDKTAGSDWSEPVAEGLSGSLDRDGATGPAAGSSLFARDCRCTRRQRRRPIARRWAQVCGLEWLARACQLVGFTLARQLKQMVWVNIYISRGVGGV